MQVMYDALPDQAGRKSLLEEHNKGKWTAIHCAANK